MPSPVAQVRKPLGATLDASGVPGGVDDRGADQRATERKPVVLVLVPREPGDFDAPRTRRPLFLQYGRHHCGVRTCAAWRRSTCAGGRRGPRARAARTVERVKRDGVVFEAPTFCITIEKGTDLTADELDQHEHSGRETPKKFTTHAEQGLPGARS